MRQITLVVHNVRSTHNVGSLLRTADGLGIQRALLSGYTPYPLMNSDTRLPHLAQKLSKQIHKTALGAEESASWQYIQDITSVITALKSEGYTIAALEQSKDSLDLVKFKPRERTALIVGREVEGIEPEVLAMCDVCLEIPMLGQKESFNVSVAAAIALYHLRWR